MKKDKLFAEFLADPSIKKSVKVDGIAGACDKLKMSPLTKNLFAALAENGRYERLISSKLGLSNYNIKLIFIFDKCHILIFWLLYIKA